MTQECKLVLVDGNNFLHRAYHATYSANLTNHEGFPTGAIRTFLNMVEKLKKTYLNVPIGIVFDAHGKSFRSEIYADYKATRKPMDEDLRVQIPVLKDIIKYQGIPIIEVQGVEADDVLGTYAQIAKDKNINIVLASGDKDLCALVCDNVLIIDTMKDIVFDREAVIQKFGVPPELIRDLLALKGDSVDNIPGMPGVGDVSATILLNQIGDIDAIKANVDKVAQLSFKGSKSFAQKLKDNEEILNISRELATIKTDVVVPIAIDEFVNTEPNHKELLPIFKKLEFKNLIAAEQRALVTSDGSNQASVQITEADSQLKLSDITLIQSIDELNNFKAEIIKDNIFNFEVYTVGASYKETKIIGLAIGNNTKFGYVSCNNLGTLDLGESSNLNLDEVLNNIKDLFQSSKIEKRTFDIKRAMHALRRYNIEIVYPYKDTLLLSHLVDSNNTQDIKKLAGKYLELDVITVEENIEDLNKKQKELGKKNSKLKFEDVDIKHLLPGIGNELQANAFLINKFTNDLANDSDIKNIFEQQENALASVLFKMEETGVAIDVLEFNRQAIILQSRLESIKSNIFQLAGKEFNISSPKQVGQILFDDLKLPIKKKSSTGQASTSEEVLQELAEDFEIARLILEYRTVAKLLNTYIEKLPNIVNSETGRIHCNFNQAGTVTGRLSSSEPNLQNIPIRTEEGRAVRNGFIARDGYTLVAADYSQVELRILAHMANEETMLKRFASKVDIHTATAAQMHGLDVKDVTPELRRSAKAINFGLIYGMSAFGLAKELGVSNSIAKNYIDSYFAQYPGIKSYMNSIKEHAKKDKFVKTLHGRKIYTKDISSSNGMLRAAAERAAINAPIQGTAAEIIKLAMVKVQEWIDSLPSDEVFLILQVHDELVFEVENSKVNKYSKKIKEIMENVVSLKVKLEVEVGQGHDWGAAH